MLIQSIRRRKRLVELDAPGILLEKEAQLTVKRMASLLGPDWLESAATAFLRDLNDAAGKCEVPPPKPGSHLAKVVTANALLRLRLEGVVDRVGFQLLPDPDLDTDRVGEDVPTIRERMGDDEFCEHARRFILGDLADSDK